MPVKVNHTKRRLQEGKFSSAFNLSRLRTVEVAQIAEAAGFHWLFIDLEHSTMDIDTASQMSMAALTTKVTPIVRVPEGQLRMGARVLDGGAQGVVFPHVDTAAEAQEIATAMRFPPHGSRSLIYGGPILEYEAIPPAEACPAVDSETMVIVMVETPKAVENVEEIAAVDGIDVVMIGGQDLCATMGIPGEIGSPRLADAVGRVVDACKANGKWAGLGGVYDEVHAKAYVERGIRLLLGGADMSFILAGAKARGQFLASLVPE